MDKNNIRDLIDRYLNGTATKEEKYLVESHYVNYLGKDRTVPHYDKIKRASYRISGKISRETGINLDQKKERTTRIWMKIAVAALILLFLTIGSFLYLYLPNIVEQSHLTVHKERDILPGGNKATLTLADGREINLSSEQSGIIIGEEITYANGQRIVGQSNSAKAGEQEVFNSVRTPKGGQYQITLPDGTSVRLNAESNLKYPSQFKDDKRIVELEGEAYFEVSHRLRKDHQNGKVFGKKNISRKESAEKIPFFVKTRHQTVEVLGTQFNISAYSDEPETKTTLVEGSVSIQPVETLPQTGGSRVGDNISRIAEIFLGPGEQSIVSDKSVSKRKVDILPYIGWKDGLFYFDNTDMREALGQIMRWYNVEVVYQDKAPTKRFFGQLKRDKKLSEVLEILQEGGVKFKMEKVGEINKLIVLTE